MSSLPIISVILPCFDQALDLDTTLRSLAAQAGPFHLHCHVVDADLGSSAQSRIETQRYLAWWQEQFSNGYQPVECHQLTFSHHSAPGAPLATCLAQGLTASTQEGAQADIMGWMAPGDSLQPGALLGIVEALQAFAPQQLSWLSCATSAAIPTAILQAGLSDGTHWPRLPAAGTFFRPWLWRKAAHDPALRIGDPGTAAWALWRLFSQNAGLVQISQDQPKGGEPEPDPEVLDAQSPLSERQAAFAHLATSLGEDAQLSCKWLTHNTFHDALIITEADARQDLQRHCNQLQHPVPELPSPLQAAKDLFRSQAARSAHTIEDCIHLHNNILAYDADWQYPAITEQHAFHQLQSLGAVPDGVTYVAYPWATLIDKMHRKSADLNTYLERFKTFCAQLPAETIKVTCCQHIKMKEELQLFHQAGISEIFWTHATRDDIAAGVQDGLRLHAFPLFPVQANDDQALSGASAQPDSSEQRPHLFSFIGARANQHYLTGSRNWILDILAEDPRGQIIGRDSWHYNKVVYEHQVRDPSARKGAAQNFIDNSASEQFRTSLLSTVFSLCPSGTGPNSIRLWESLGLGAIPVILADSWAPPGDPALWQGGAIFCDETPEAIAALPDRLEALASDPETLARLRHGAAQLWALYGPHSFIYDLQKFLIEAADRKGITADPAQATLSALHLRLAQELTTATAPTTQQASLYIVNLASHLLMQGSPAHAAHQEDSLAQWAETLARESLPTDHPLLVNLDRVCDMLQHRSTRRARRQNTPGLLRQAPLRVCLMGKHANRTPLAYAPFQKRAANRVSLVHKPQAADVVLTGFNTDLREIGAELLAVRRSRPDLQVAILSEEPLWDSIWSGDLMPRQRQLELPEGLLDYHVFNHSNADIFDFETIPYFLLTRSDFQARYGLLLARHSHLSPRALLQHWQSAPIPAAFYAEVRENPAYSKTWPDQDVAGLSVYRTDVAQAVELPGTLREGQGWRPGAKRQALPDWHLDKIAALDMRCKVVSAYENTHQNAYISEKIFDAFVTGGVPTYYAGPNHRVHDLVPEAAMINTYGLSAKEAAAKIAGFTPDLAFAEAWLETARKLQSRFTNLGAIAQERARITDAVIAALDSCRS